MVLTAGAHAQIRDHGQIQNEDAREALSKAMVGLLGKLPPDFSIDMRMSHDVECHGGKIYGFHPLLLEVKQGMAALHQPTLD
eukprot:4716173-Karenia_brevis.AAC.1